MFVPVPPQPDQPKPTPPPEPVEPDDAQSETAEDEGEYEAADDDAADLDLPALRGPMVWLAVVRWARLCRVLAYVSLIIFGFLAARNLYLAVRGEPQVGPFMPPPRVEPVVYLGEAVLCVIYGVASCISLLGFAELLHVFLSIEAGVHRQRDRQSPGREPDDV